MKIPEQLDTPLQILARHRMTLKELARLMGKSLSSG